MASGDLPTMSFDDRAAAHAWLERNHARSPGIRVRIFKKGSAFPTVSVDDLVDEALCFGWTDGERRREGETSFLQQIAPRDPSVPESSRNRKRIQALMGEGRMTPAGVAALG